MKEWCGGVQLPSTTQFRMYYRQIHLVILVVSLPWHLQGVRVMAPKLIASLIFIACSITK